jgi:antitoxin component of MazEF toxin-antitoxin module
MVTTIPRLGNSLGVRISKPFAVASRPQREQRGRSGLRL